jgi:hypothetical protein
MCTIVQSNSFFFVVFVVPFAVCGSGIIFSLHMRQQSQFSLLSYDLGLMYYFQWPSCVWSQVLMMKLPLKSQFLIWHFFFKSADPIYCFEIQKVAFSTIVLRI